MEMQQLGYNCRITDLQCSLGISQLRKIDWFMKKRKLIAAIYDLEFKELINARISQSETRNISGNHLYMLLVDFNKINKTRKKLFEEFYERGIGLHAHYIPIPMHPYYQINYKYNIEDYPNVLNYYNSAITLPIFVSMTDEQIKNVVSSVKEFIG